jgi:hypothetical protein
MEELTRRKAPSADLASRCSSPVARAAAGLGKRGAWMPASSESRRELKEGRGVSVRKIVPTLTSRSAQIGLSMAGAKQHWDTRFILVPAVGRTSSRGALVALYCKAPWCS